MKTPEQLIQHMRTLAFAYTYSDPDFAGDRSVTLFHALLLLADEITRPGVDRAAFRTLMHRAAGQEWPAVPGATAPTDSRLDILTRTVHNTKHSRGNP